MAMSEENTTGLVANPDDEDVGGFFGWKKDRLDFRDHQFGISVSPLALPPVVDLRKTMPLVYNQGATNSCTAQAIAACCEYEWITHQKGPDFIPSRLYIYYNTRWLDNDVNNDNGGSLRDGMKAINKWGFCKEPYWPFNVKHVRVRPPNSAYSDGGTRRVYYYGTVNQNRNALMGTLASGQPIIFGIAVYSSLNSNATTKTGIVPMPRASESLLGGHAIVLMGYDISTRLYKFRNSWGSRWGDGGYGYLPFEYVENRNLASDFWAVRSI